MRGDFYPRPPRGGRRRAENVVTADTLFLSTPSARRATHPRFCCSGESGISIHALREEGDVCGSPHAGHHKGFLSTPSARRATPMSRSICARRSKFLSTPSARRATKVGGHGLQVRRISIHALREEGDLSRMAQNLQQVKFLSTPSARRATSQASNKSHRPKPFLSTPSARRATFFRCTSCWIDTISIHALREEGDILRGIGQWRNSDFYPRPPRGGRLLFRCHLQRLFCISIHALREEGDRKRHRAVGTDTNFYPRPPRGGRLSTGSCFCLTL